MAECIWRGTTDGDAGDATNWSTGTVPVTADTVTIPKDATVDITEGLDQHAVVLAGFTKEAGCSINIGTSTSPLQYGMAAAAPVSIDGSGATYLELAGTASSTNTITIRGGGTIHLASYSTNELASSLVISGDADVYLAWDTDEAAKVDTIEKTGGGGLYIGDSVTATDGSAITSITTRGGTTTNESNVATIISYAATYVQTGGTWTTGYAFGGSLTHEGSGTATATYVRSGGTLEINANVTFTAITLDDSVVTFADCPTTCMVGAVHLYGASQYDDPYGMVTTGAVLSIHDDAGVNSTVNPGINKTLTIGNL